MRTDLALVGFLALAAVACSDSTGSTNLCANSGAAATVTATDNYAFTPSTVTISVGQSVCWQNVGTLNHTTTQTVNPGQIGVWDRDLPAGQTVVVTINLAGTWPYNCKLHAGMTGTVVVNP